MRIYFELALRAFRQLFAYQAAMLAGIFTNSVFGVMLSAVYLALFRSHADGTSVEGFSARETVTYVWIGQALIAPVMIWGWWEIIKTIRTGAIVTDMLKPLSFFGFWLSRDLGRAMGHLLLRGVPTLIIGALFYDLVYPGTPGRWLAFLVSIPFAVIVSFCFRFIINLWGFWVLDHRGIAGIAIVIVGVASGHLLPIAWYPNAFRDVLNMLPFRAIVMLPVEIWLGQVGIVEGLGLQVFWILVMTAAAHWLQSVAERKVVVQGG
ncbi:MAG TPA: ABC-2 family transporter protein [Thermomicrobiales bacterium]|nr:ABC-2 family transporter protein [Thermomicrobiales bacterium]